MEVEKVVIFADEHTIVVDKPLGMTIETDYIDRSEFIFDLSMSYRHENVKYIPKKVFILQKDSDGFRIYDRYTKYDANKCDGTFTYGDCPYISYTRSADIDDIIWNKDTSKKVYEKFKKDGFCICATQEIAEALKSVFEKAELEGYVKEVETEFMKLQEKFEEMKKHVL